MSTIPVGWNEVTLAELGEIVAAGTPSRAMPSFWNSDIPWITPSDVTALSGKYVHETRECISREGLAASAATLLPIGSLLVTSRATLGEVAIAGVAVATNQGFKNIIPNEATYPLFAYYQIATLKRQMERRASGRTCLEISRGDFARIQTLRPGLDEQKHIALALDCVDTAITQTQTVIIKLKQVREGLVHDRQLSP